MSLQKLIDPYDIALTSWTLISIGSFEVDMAIEKLNRHMREQGECIRYFLL